MVDMTPSAAYIRALEEARTHHLDSKTYSGRFLRPHAQAVKGLIERHGATSILDYGCGKGDQYQWVGEGKVGGVPAGMTLEQFWGVPVHKYDPAWPPLAKPEPEEIVAKHGRFGVTLVTHVLGSIPIFDLTRWVFPRLAELTSGAIYIAEKVGPVRKQVITQTEILPRWPAPYWSGMVQAASTLHPEQVWCLNVHDRVDDRKVMTMQSWKAGRALKGEQHGEA